MMQFVWGELLYAREQLLDVRRIRVTVDAIPGSPAVVPFTPERLRALYLRAHPDGVVADLVATDRWRELVMHPRDWHDLVLDSNDHFNELELNPNPERVFGVPVLR